MKKAVFVTNGIYDLSNGRSIASYGYCKEFSKYIELKVFCPLPENKTAKNEIEGNLNIEYCRENRDSIFEKIRRAKDIIIVKKTGIIGIFHANTYKKLSNYLKNNNVDLVIIDHLAMARFFFRLKKEFPNTQFVYNSHNAEGVNYYQSLTGKDYDIGNAIFRRKDFHSIFDYLKFMYVLHIEKRMIKETDYSIAISKNDRELLCKQYNVPETKILHTKPVAKFSRIKKAEDLERFHYKLLIVGSMGWYPNVRGIIWFVENVFDRLIKDKPEYKLYIVGRGPLQELKDMAAKYAANVVLTGEVSSTEPYFAECDISVVPVFEGTGIKIKVLESIARGIPTICSGFAAKDYDLNGEVLVADDPECFLRCIEQFAQSPELRKRCYDGMKSFCDNYYQLTEDMKGLFGCYEE